MKYYNPPQGDILRQARDKILRRLRTSMAYRPKDTQERILHRLKIARGHLEKVIKMVEEDKYCIDILHQSQAVQAGLKETDNLILENHLKTCAADAIRGGNTDKAITEVLEVFRKSS